MNKRCYAEREMLISRKTNQEEEGKKPERLERRMAKEYHWREKRNGMALEEMLSSMAKMIEERDYHVEMDTLMTDLRVEDDMIGIETWEEEDWILECLDRLEYGDIQMEVVESTPM